MFDRCQVGLNADNWLDVAFLSLTVEFYGSVHGPVIRQGQGRHLQLGSATHQIINVCETIQQGIFAVDV